MHKFLATFAFLPALAFGAANDVTLQQRNSMDTGSITRTPVNPSPASGLMSYNGSTLLPEWLTLGTNLSITSGVLNAAGGVPVNSDWNATTGLAKILNKPTIATVGMTGQYADLTGAPTITPFNYGYPNARSLALSTSFQASDNTKAAIVSVSVQCTNATTVVAASACTLQARISNTTATCSSGTVVATWTSTYALGLLLTNTSGSPFDLKMPTGAFAILCPTSGTFTISAVDQTAG